MELLINMVDTVVLLHQHFQKLAQLLPNLLLNHLPPHHLLLLNHLPLLLNHLPLPHHLLLKRED